MTSGFPMNSPSAPPLPPRTRAFLLVLATVAAACPLGLVLASGPASAPSLYYSGYVEDNGTPLTGTHVIEVNLWTSATSTNTTDRQCTTLPPGGTSVRNGHFRIQLNPSCAQAVLEFIRTCMWR